MLNENDYLEKPYKLDFDAPAAKAHPFLVYKGKLYVGERNQMHAQLLIQKFDNEDLDYSLDGRIWTGPKVITFWEWPTNVKSFLNRIVNEAAKQQKIKIDLKTWKIEVRDPDTKKLIYVPISDVLRKDTKLIKQGKSVLLKHLVSPMDKERKPTPIGVGSRRRVTGAKPGESPVQTRYRTSVAEASELRDRALRAVAEKAFSDLVSASKRVKDWTTDKNFRLNTDSKRVMFFVDASKIVKDVKVLDVILHDGTGSAKYHVQKNVIVIGNMSSVMADRLRTQENPRAITLMFIKLMEQAKSTFIHEFIHYIDFEKRGMKNINFDTRAISKSKDIGDPENADYLNSPEEFNAYYQQGAHRIEELLRELKKDPTLLDIITEYVPTNFNDFIKKEFNPRNRRNAIWAIEWLAALTPKNRKKFIKRVAPLHKRIAKLLSSQMNEKTERDYKAEYKKFQSSPKMKKYRAELNKYNRDAGTYGNGDGKDASHKGGKIAGMEDESTNRGRAEKSRLKGSKRKN